jgi:hypothetical protein
MRLWSPEIYLERLIYNLADQATLKEYKDATSIE